jgi:hypothetical protein
MKVRESGMPAAEMWNTFFDPISILNAVKLTSDVRNAVDFGCGYSTSSGSSVVNGGPAGADKAQHAKVTASHCHRHIPATDGPPFISRSSVYSIVLRLPIPFRRATCRQSVREPGIRRPRSCANEQKKK